MRVRSPEGPEQFRLFSYLMFTLIQRIDRIRREVYADDLDLASISEAIALSAIEARMRDPQFRNAYRSVNRQAGVAVQRGVNALSVAAATGIPRETVRRKLKMLVEKGVLVREGRRLHLQAGQRAESAAPGGLRARHA